MRKRLWLAAGLVVVLLLALLPSACAPESEQAEGEEEAQEEGPIVLTLAGYQAPEHIISRAEHRWADLVETETKGRLLVNVRISQELGKASELHELAAKGVIDISGAVVPYAAELLPFCADSSMLPFAWRYPDDHFRALDRGIGDLFEAGYNEKNLHAFFNIPSYGQEWFFSEKVRTLEDLKGLKCRSFGGLGGLVMEGLGMTPVVLTTPEIYMAAQQGLIDAISHSYGSYFLYKEYEVCPYCVTVDTFSQTLPHAMNLDVWQSLPSDIKAIVDSTGREVAEWALEQDKAASLEQINDYVEQKLMEFYEPPDDERARWVEAGGPPFYEAYVEKYPERGKQVVEIINSFYKEYGIAPIEVS